MLAMVESDSYKVALIHSYTSSSENKCFTLKKMAANSNQYFECGDCDCLWAILSPNNTVDIAIDLDLVMELCL